MQHGIPPKELKKLGADNSQGNQKILELTSIPEDSFTTFMVEIKTPEQDWAEFWKLDMTDMGDKSRTQIKRQFNIREIVTSEHRYLRDLQVLRYFYKYRLILGCGLPLGENRVVKNEDISDSLFPGCEAIYHANETLLYLPLKKRESSQGPWIMSFWDIFQNWLTQSGDFYLEYCSQYPGIHEKIRKEERLNPKFSAFLDQSRCHPRSNRLMWDACLRAPIVRIQRYVLHLQTVLKDSDESDTKHGCAELRKLIDDIRGFVARCDVAVQRAAEKVKLNTLRSRLGAAAGQRILPENSQIQYTASFLHKESRFQIMKDVTVLVIREPEVAVFVLKESLITASVEDRPLEIVAEVSKDTKIYVIIQLFI